LLPRCSFVVLVLLLRCQFLARCCPCLASALIPCRPHVAPTSPIQSPSRLSNFLPHKPENAHLLSPRFCTTRLPEPATQRPENGRDLQPRFRAQKTTHGSAKVQPTKLHGQNLGTFSRPETGHVYLPNFTSAGCRLGATPQRSRAHFSVRWRLPGRHVWAGGWARDRANFRQPHPGGGRRHLSWLVWSSLGLVWDGLV